LKIIVFMNYWAEPTLHLKRYDEAIQAYQSALEIVPPNTEYGHQIPFLFTNLAKELI